MSVSTFNLRQSESAIHDPAKIVFVCEALHDRSEQRFLRALASLSAVEPDVIELQARSAAVNLSGRVLRFGGFSAEKGGGHRLVGSLPSQAVWDRCEPGALHERLIRYCMRSGAKLVVLPETLGKSTRGWWSRPLAETLSRHIPVLSIPKKSNWGQFGSPQRQMRWLVPLDGSASAEAVLGSLRSLVRWLPSELLLVQPLE